MRCQGKLRFDLLVFFFGRPLASECLWDIGPTASALVITSADFRCIFGRCASPWAALANLLGVSTAADAT